jgi:hypothetical protein
MARGRLLQSSLTTKDQFDTQYTVRSFPWSFSNVVVEQATAHELLLGPEKK